MGWLRSVYCGAWFNLTQSSLQHDSSRKGASKVGVSPIELLVYTPVTETTTQPFPLSASRLFRLLAGATLASQLIVVLAVGFASSISNAADKIEFPDDELAAESVVPIFEKPESVKFRSIRTAGRFEIGPELSDSLLEPFYNPISIGGTATYHFNEISAFNVFGSYFLQGLSDNANNLNPIPGKPGINMNLQYAPQPKFMVLGNYQFTPFYGKISLTKEFVMNLNVFGFVGAGGIMIGDGLKPAADLGLGQKLYFTRNFALRLDLRFLAYQGPDVLSRNLNQVTQVQSTSSFDQKIIFSGLLSVGAVILL